MHFSRLLLSGFKSFADPTELVIEPGLTGIVGPNGCGKSNLLEALLWAMGEASARRMRGGGMDDVIFSGSESRPGRNVAEVSLSLDNSGRDAPAAWNDGDRLEIARRIQRGAGSDYRINGMEARARDVQLLFADLATGIRSSGLVSQDQIAALIRARPQARRHLLEEAAGTAGLQSRRHEAQLRLRAAETNLERLGDSADGLHQRLAALQRQARQARRYRRLGERIRDAEGRWLLRRWQDGREALAGDEEALAAVQAALDEATRLAAAAAGRQAEATAALAPARDAEAEAGAALNELKLAGVALDSEEGRIEERQRGLASQLDRIGADLEREATLADDAARALAELRDEEAQLAELRTGEEAAIAAARAALDEAGTKAATLEARATALAEERARRRAARQALEERAGDLARRLARLEKQASDIDAERGRGEHGGSDDAARLRSEESDAARALAATRDGLAAAQLSVRERRQREEACRARFRDADAALAGHEAERDALAALVGPGEAGGEPVIDLLRVAPGCEAALGAALGEDLEAPLGEEGAAGWTLLPPLDDAPALPRGAEPLGRHVQGPPQLARRLAQTGIVDDADGDRLARQLKPGQRLASRSGRLWRWDGFVVRRAGGGAAARLAQRARRQALAGEIAAAAQARDEAARALAAAAAALASAVESEDAARNGTDAAALALERAREARRREQSRLEIAAARERELAAGARRIGAERAELATAREAVARDLAAMPPAAADDGLDDLRDALQRQRRDLAARQGEHDRLRGEAAFRQARAAAIRRERRSWQERAERARARIADLERKRLADRREAGELAAKPALIAERRRALAEKLAAAEARRRRAGDRRAAAENTLREAEGALRQAEARLADRREERAHREGAVERARHVAAEIAGRIDERLQTTPEALAAALGEDERLAAADELERLFRRLLGERDGMGPVNLRAEGEAGEIERQLAAMLSERDDLEAAIARLRGGIAELDREGRQRLKAAFEEIDGHFRHLFERLFGGHARLRMTASDDPLEAGLEIEASPSGKRLQSLSLLSGGEQALTAIALVFALFLTNPSPLCVLDEVDAPLDDANVERFCGLLDEFARSGRTRFLIITHHRVTMSRMDRLFGVTMGEAGVSQLVSVDLARAERLHARQEAS